MHMKFYTIGQTFKKAMALGEPIPVVVKDDEDDTQQIKKVKEIIRNMIHVEPKLRTALWMVQDKIENILHLKGNIG